MFKSKSSKADKLALKRRRQQQQQLQQQQLLQLQAPVFKQDYFENCHRTYSCIHCRAHLANHDELISKLFQGNHGRAYLFNKVVNVGCKKAVQRELLTGLHAVADIYCDSCETILGWKYEQAFVPSQKYKEGKYIIELVHIFKENDWDLTSYNNRELLDHFTHHQMDSTALCDCKTLPSNGYCPTLSPNHLNYYNRPYLAQIRASRSCLTAPTYQVANEDDGSLGEKLITSSVSISNDNNNSNNNNRNSSSSSSSGSSNGGGSNNSENSNINDQRDKLDGGGTGKGTTN